MVYATAMYFDALTLAAVASDLQHTICGGRIQRVWLPAQHSIALEIYAQQQRHYLIASAHPQHARVHLTMRKPSRGVEQPTPLLLLLRKYVQGGRVAAVENPALERILLLSIVKDMRVRNRGATGDVASSADPDSLDADDPAAVPLPAPTEADLLHCDLIIEPMERRSNIMLVNDANVIMDSVKRVTASMSQRLVLPQQPYMLPPPQEKRDPRNATAAGMAALLQEHGSVPLAKALVASYRGVSPQVAREVAQRSTGSIHTTLAPALPWETIAACVRGLYSGQWEPSLVAGVAGEPPQAYAPYLLTHLAGARKVASISAALDAFYTAREELADHSQYRASIERRLAEVAERLQHQLAQIERELLSNKQ